MKAITISLFVLVSGLHSYTFTSKDGSTFMGTLLSVDETTVTIQRKEDGRNFTIPKSRFSEKDGSYFQEWLESQKKLKAFGELYFFESRISVEKKLMKQNSVTMKSHTYEIYPVFEDNVLVSVELRGRSGKLSTYRDTVVKDQHDEMRTILSEAYERETPLYETIFGMTPYEQVAPDIPEGYTKFTYIYEDSIKQARIGITHTEGRIFNLYVDIRNLDHERRKTERETKAASSLY